MWKTAHASYATRAAISTDARARSKTRRSRGTKWSISRLVESRTSHPADIARTPRRPFDANRHETRLRPQATQHIARRGNANQSEHDGDADHQQIRIHVVLFDSDVLACRKMPALMTR